MKRPLDALLDELNAGDKMPSLASLYYLSGLDEDDAQRVRQTWTHLPVGMRRSIIAALVEAAEADFELNFGALFRIGIEDEDAQVRAASIDGLWEDEDVRLVPSLVACLRDDEASTVRAAAATSLGRFVLLGELEKIRPGPQNMAYQALLAACQNPHEDLEVQRRALESLAYADEEIVATLIRQAYDAPEEEMRISAVFAMGRSADPAWACYVQRELSSPSPALRYEAARACGELQLTESVPELEELVEDVDPEVQEAALWALGQIGGAKAREILERYCHSEDEAIQAAAEAALDELEFLHGDLTDFFGRLLKDHDEA